MNPGLVVKLRPSGPWRIGPDSGARNRVDVIYHSDSLYSAVTSAMVRLGRLDDWLAATAKSASPAVSFSSCFPFIEEVGFVVPPRTVWPPQAVSLKAAQVRWKSARFIPLGMVQSVLAGNRLDENRWEVDGESGCLVPAGRKGPFRTSVRWSAAVDRLSGASERHSTACIEFRPGAGLWTVVGFADEAAREEWQDLVKAAFRLLADTGFGGERSRGWGRSEAPEFIEGELPGMILGEAPAEAKVAAPPVIVPMAAPAVPEVSAAPERAADARAVEMLAAPEESVVAPEEPVGAPAEVVASPEQARAVAGEVAAAPEEAAAAPEEGALPQAVADVAADEARPVVDSPERVASEKTVSAPQEAALPQAFAEVTADDARPVEDSPEVVAAAPEKPISAPQEAALPEAVAEVAADDARPVVDSPEVVAAASEEEAVSAPQEAALPEAVAEVAPEEARPGGLPQQEEHRPGGLRYTSHWMLSLFAPGAEDRVDWGRGNYTVLARGGRVDSPAGSGELKKQVQMVAEGSVLVAESAPKGAAPDVAPDGFAHPVFRAGFALAIPLPERN